MASAVAAGKRGEGYRIEVPKYAKTEQPRGQGLTGEALDKALALWKLDFPDRVN